MMFIIQLQAVSHTRLWQLVATELQYLLCVCCGYSPLSTLANPTLIHLTTCSQAELYCAEGLHLSTFIYSWDSMRIGSYTQYQQPQKFSLLPSPIQLMFCFLLVAVLMWVEIGCLLFFFSVKYFLVWLVLQFGGMSPEVMAHASDTHCGPQALKITLLVG